MKQINCGACKGTHKTVQEVFTCHNTVGVFKLQEEDSLAAEMPKREFVKRNEQQQQGNAARKGNIMNTNERVPFAGIIKCEACGGTGKWPTLQNKEGIHFACKGTGRLKEMSEKQFSFIRELFMKMVILGIISEDEQSQLTKVMNDHKHAVTFQTSKWASKKIDEFKSRINRHKTSKINARLQDQMVFEEQDNIQQQRQEEEEVW